LYSFLATSTGNNPIPIILTEDGGGHFVVATGIAQNDGTSTYAVRDSAWYLTQYLNQSTSTDTSTTINGYDNDAEGIHFYHDPPTIPRLNTYAINLPNSLILVDAQGRRTGKDPQTGTLYHEIPDTAYEEDFLSPGHGSGQLNFFTPTNGKYTLYVLGGQTGPYRLDSWVDDGAAKPPVPQRVSGTIEAGSVITFDQTYDMTNTKGSALFASSTIPSVGSITSTPPHNLPLPPAPIIPEKAKSLLPLPTMDSRLGPIPSPSIAPSPVSPKVTSTTSAL
jgi:hypothetical protein